MRQRTEGVGILTKEDAIRLGVTGSVLRASGVPYDIRKAEPYDVYNEIHFKVQYMKTADSFARAYVPFLDMRESCHILRQLLDKMPEAGEVRAKLQAKTGQPVDGGVSGTLRWRRGAETEQSARSVDRQKVRTASGNLDSSIDRRIDRQAWRRKPVPIPC